MSRLLKKSISALLSVLVLFSLLAPHAVKAAGSGTGSASPLIDDTVRFYKQNATKLDSWWQIVALWGAGENLHSGVWTLPAWTEKDPGFKVNAGGTDHIQKIFGLLALDGDPSGAWETKRNLFAELAAQQNEATGAIGGINKHIWAVLALDTGVKLGYNVGGWNAAAKDKALGYLLGKQLADGGFALSGSVSDTDITGMALLALGNYQSNSAAVTAIERAKALLKQRQLDNAGFDSVGPWGAGDNSNSLSAAVSGLVAVGENLLTPSWTKNGMTAVDSFRRFQVADGSFSWKVTPLSKNLMATEQALIALLDVQHQKSVWQRIAEKPVQTSVQLSVYGINGPIFPAQTVTAVSYGRSAKAIEAFQQGLNQAGISYDIEQTSYGPYLKSVAGQTAGSLGGWDGWMYEVNGVSPDVGIGDYTLKPADALKFYYSRWPSISTAASIPGGTVNPALTVKLVGDTFTGTANQAVNWKFDPGVTGLSIGGVERKTDQEVVITFAGQAKGGTLKLQALPAALVSNLASEEVRVIVPLIVSGKEDQTFEIAPGTSEVLVSTNTNERVFNNVTLKFDKPQLPKLFADRGSVLLEIAEKTEVTSEWDKQLQLPKQANEADSAVTGAVNTVLHASNQKLDQINARVQIGGPKHISFNQHVTLKLKGLGDKEAGFIDQNGKFYAIAKYPNAATRSDDVYAYNDQGDLIIKTKHFTDFVAYKPVSNVVVPPGGGAVTSTVTLSVEKRSLGEGDIVAPASVTLQSGDTAFTLLQRTLSGRSIALEYTGSDASLYVQSIDHLGEFDRGPDSGWMYSVNGTFPNYSAGSYTLQNGDVLRWQYTKDLGKDIGNEYKNPSTGGGAGAPAGSAVSQETGDQTQRLAEIGRLAGDAANWITAHQDFAVRDAVHDWDALALVRSGHSVPAVYLEALEKDIEARQGKLDLVTDDARVALAAAATGKDPLHLAGYNVIQNIYNNSGLTQQGATGAAWALLALDSKSYQVPADALWTREKLVDRIIKEQNQDGGFAASPAPGGVSDPDATALALQALAGYQTQPAVKTATDRAITWLSGQQLAGGGIKGQADERSESTSQAIIALSGLGIKPDDSRFVKTNGNLWTALQSFTSADGGFAQVRGGESDAAATRAALLALTAYKRHLDGQSALYRIGDDLAPAGGQASTGANYADAAAISAWAKQAVAQAAALGLMNGTGKQFEPKRELTRAEFAALVVRYAGAEAQGATGQPFRDVPADAWYAKYAAAAKAKGWISGDATNAFAPDQPITRQEVAAILVRVKGLAAEQPTATFRDQDSVSPWAQAAVNTAYKTGLMTGDDGYFRPLASLTREMAAVVIVRLHEQKK